MTTNNNKHLPPAQLWIGPHEHVCSRAELFLQQQFCTHKRCKKCTTCRLIHERQYHGAIWLYPQKWYTLDQLTVIFETISFSLNPNQHVFFIIQKADFLTSSCSNSLLKSVEEPPAGYHFIFLAERKDAILPTIRSRCILHTYQAKSTLHEKEQLISCLIDTKPTSPVLFTQLLEKMKPNEQESRELLDKLIIYWMQKTKQAATQNKKQYKTACTIVAILGEALEKPPMPGSSLIFWKNLFLRIK